MGSKKYLYIGIAVLVLGIGFAIGTYAYYQSSKTGSLNATVLYWNCSKTVTNETTVLNGLYPGKSGSIVFNLSCAMTADYYIYVTAMSHMGSNSDHPNLNLYKTSSYNTTNLITANTATTDTSKAVASGTVTGGTPTTKTIYYNWPYGSVEDYDADSPSFSYVVVFKQKQ